MGWNKQQAGFIPSGGVNDSKRGHYNVGKDNSHYKHGMAGSREYETWSNIKARCYNPKNSHYKHYGGRGIKVCDRWLKFENFYEDMGDRPKNMTIDRENVNGDYEPSNCRWATRSVQAINTRKLGVRRLPSGKYQARVLWKSLGVYPSESEALKAVRQFRKSLIGEKLNVVQ